MRAFRLGIVVAMLGLTACETTTPPGTRITDIKMLAGTYTGQIEETGVVNRPARIAMFPDGAFEITVEEPGGFRFNGHAIVNDDGGLTYRYDRGKGRATIHEGDGRRVIVFTREDDRETITVSKSLP
jgi:hypothetical protein